MKDNRKLIERIIDWSKYIQRQEIFHTSWIENGFEVCTDTHRIVRLYNPLHNDIEIKEDIISKFYKDINENSYVAVDLPSIDIIKAEIKKNIGQAYKSKRCLYRIGDDSELAVVNAKYLLDIMEILNPSKIYYNEEKPRTTSLLIKSEIGDALLLPINSFDNNVGFWTK